MKNIGIISIHSAPYRNPVLSNLMENDEYNFKIITLYDYAPKHLEWEKPKNLSYNNTFCEKTIEFPLFGDFHYEIFSYIKNKFDLLIIPGHYPSTNLFLIFKSIVFNIPFIYSADTVDFFNIYKKNIFKKSIIKYFINKSVALWVPGKASKDYFKKVYDVDRNKIFEGLYMLDSERIYNRVNSLKEYTSDIRKEINIGEDKYLFLFVGKLIDKRNIINLLSAFKLATKKIKNLALLIIGNGPNTYKVKDFISKNKNLNISHIPGVPFKKLHKYYSCSNAYIHPGEEPYSLALVEAVISGLPIISTKKVGAVYDYVEDGFNGYLIESNNYKLLSKAMIDVKKQKISVNNLKNAQKFSIEERNKNWATKQLLENIEKIK